MRLNQKLTLGILGTGNMSRAFVRALNKSDIFKGNIGARGRTETATSEFASKLQVDNRFDPKAWSNMGIWTLGVKPNQVSAATKPLMHVYETMAEKPVIVSLMAGVSMSALSAVFPNAVIVKVMANLAIAETRPMFAVCSNDGDQANNFIRELEAIGHVIRLNEDKMHMATVLLGSGPALFIAIQNKLLEIAKSDGFSDVDALAISKGALQGAACLSANDASPQDLINQIASPGGTTQAALSVVHERGLLGFFDEAVAKACEKSIEISYNSENNANSD